ncbi:hypothetical protein [Bacillus sp. PS06]|uniref:hypothetical protein n=1 Tax=Bacillus sp. PS06 TaxID=2764176 RepID=UPI001782F3C6|nr:hypothetical protein [Bacillus sp. PS06]MBD8068642.1 hypothetical protein [Bacillus sp. PS06]
MTKNTEELKKQLQKFCKLMEEYPDQAESIHYFKSFLRQLIRSTRNSTIVLPTIEIMTILQHEKPRIFHLLKMEAKGDYNLEFLTGLRMDYIEAKTKLEFILRNE